MKILGFESKKTTWKVVSSSIKKLSKTELSQIDRIVSRQSSYHEDSYYAVIFLMNGEYINLPLIDINCKVDADVELDPESLKVFNLTNGEKVITRVYAKPL